MEAMNATTRPPIPPKVAAAIASVMAEVPKLEKGETNAHGKYKFASIDDFLEAVRPLCKNAGLIIVPDEEECEVSDEWLRLKFSFTLSHKDGETWEHRPTRTVLISSRMGSQAFGAAQSYAMKQFMRGLFLIATGDGEDADTQPHGTLPSKPANGNGNPPPRPQRQQYQQNGNGASSAPPATPPVKSVAQAKQEIDEASKLGQEQMSRWKAANVDWLDKLQTAKPDKYRELMNHFDQMWTFA